MGWLRARKERRLAERDEYRQLRRLVDEDVTVFGEQLAGLHVETLGDPLGAEAQADYRRALELYDDAKRAFAGAQTAAAVREVVPVLVDGRYHLACVLARRDGHDLPARREPCFFNPQHGPAADDVPWTPRGGVEREVPVCRADLLRLTAGREPEVRQVRIGDRWVPWYQQQEARGLLATALGPRALEGVPKYVMFQADLDRMGDALGGSGAGGMGGI
ncbi:hypothetical protein [Nocardioides taihuensis]|uniref:Uncharacterized protein n=1 Tax=Nocardioides taihuensis TaxID=1835606 RepID=A0ABW0BFL7_9ACTN